MVLISKKFYNFIFVFVILTWLIGLTLYFLVWLLMMLDIKRYIDEDIATLWPWSIEIKVQMKNLYYPLLSHENSKLADKTISILRYEMFHFWSLSLLTIMFYSMYSIHWVKLTLYTYWICIIHKSIYHFESLGHFGIGYERECECV